jgi:hypothetical protein
MKNKTNPIGVGITVLAVLALLIALLPGRASAAKTPESSVTLTFSDSGVTASGTESGYKIEGTDLTINASGVYTITGSCAEGSVTVKKGTTGVTLVLDGLTLASSDGAPLCLNKESGATVYLAGVNTLTDDEDPADEESTDALVADAFDGAAVKVKANASLTITGSGTLNVNGNAKNGVKGGDDAAIVIEGGKLNITAAQDGVNANADLTITGGTLNVSAGDDGIHSDATLTIGAEGASTGPTINILDSSEGLEGADIVLNAGSGTIISTDDGVNAAADGVASSLTVNGGEWYVNADGDGLDAGGDSNGDNGTIVLNGGTVTVFGAANSGNSALDAGRGITYNGGTLLAVGMSGMAEAPSGGNVLVFGGGMGGMNGGMGGNMGGMPGGFGGQQPPQGGMNGDFGGQMPPQGGMSGGFGGQMPQMGRQGQQANGQQPQSNSGSISITSGSKIAITDASGNVLYEATGVKNANCVVFASDKIAEGETYTLTVDGKEAATATAGETSGMTGGFGGMGGMNGMNGQQPQFGGREQQNGQQPQANNQPGGNQTNGQTQPSGNQPNGNQTNSRTQPNTTAPAAANEPVKAVVSPQKLTVNSAECKAEAYNIGGYNYFKLRDLATLLNGTNSQFGVVYDSARRTVVIVTGSAYTPVGGELATGKDNSASVVKSTQSVEINGKTVELTAYNLGGSNFFKLRDLADALGFDVDYDQTTNTAVVTSR